MNVICFGLSHRMAPVALREKFAIAEAGLADSAAGLMEKEEIEEAVVLSTCNRVEIYAAAQNAEAAFRAAYDFMRERAPECFHPDIFYKYHSLAGVRHLFRVVCGLDSMVLGETEILGQVKKAYEAALSGGATARHLNKLFQGAFRAAKEARGQTNISRGPMSAGSVAVDLAEKIFGCLSRCKVMLLGAGVTGEATARALVSRGAGSFLVSNRAFDRAASLAARLGGEVVPFEQWSQRLHEVNILISSTAAPRPLLTRNTLEPIMRARKDGPLFVIDLSVPRNAEPSIAGLHGVHLYDIDSIEAVAEESLKIRRQDVALCEKLIERHANAYLLWLDNASCYSETVQFEPTLA